MAPVVADSIPWVERSCRGACAGPSGHDNLPHHLALQPRGGKQQGLSRLIGMLEMLVGPGMGSGHWQSPASATDLPLCLEHAVVQWSTQAVDSGRCSQRSQSPLLELGANL